MEVALYGFVAVVVFLVILLLFPSGGQNSDIQNRLAQLDGADPSVSQALPWPRKS